MKVQLLVPEGGIFPSGAYEFEVPPVAGAQVALTADGRREYYEVEETWHAMRHGSFAYFAVLARSARPKWLNPDDYSHGLLDE